MSQPTLTRSAVEPSVCSPSWSAKGKSSAAPTACCSASPLRGSTREAKRFWYTVPALMPRRLANMAA